MKIFIYIFILISLSQIIYSQEIIRSNGSEIKLLEKSSCGYFISKMTLNPYSPAFIDTIGLKDSSHVNLFLTDTSGNKMKTIYSGFLNKGIYLVYMDIRIDGNKLPPSGLYYFEMEAKSIPWSEDIIFYECIFSGKTLFLRP